MSADRSARPVRKSTATAFSRVESRLALSIDARA